MLRIKIKGNILWMKNSFKFVLDLGVLHKQRGFKQPE